MPVRIEDIQPKSDNYPICPHCESELDTIYRIRDEKGFFEGKKGYCYICSQCRKVLGLADYMA